MKETRNNNSGFENGKCKSLNDDDDGSSDDDDDDVEYTMMLM